MKIWKRVSLRCLVLISSRAMDWYEQKSAVTCWISSLARPSNWGGGSTGGGSVTTRLGPPLPDPIQGSPRACPPQCPGSTEPPLSPHPSILPEKETSPAAVPPYPRQHEIPDFLDDWSFFPELLHGFGERIWARMRENEK